MTPERHLRMQEIFEAAIDLSLAARKAFLQEACGADVELQASVLDLLEADESTDPITTLELAPGLATVAVQACPQCGHCYEEALLVCPRDQQRLDFALPGSLLIDGKYRLERLIGRGGMGAVYLVTHVHLNKKFALKVIATEGEIPESYRNNFENEAHALGRLSHPNIVSVTDYGVDPRGGGLPYLVMEYLEGETVRQFVERRGALPFDEAVLLLRDIARAVDAAHAQNIVHGDLKSSNLFLAKEVGRERIVKVVDFGLARLAPPGGGEEAPATASAYRQTSRGSVRGTPAYMAPELFEGQTASAASDRFALGALTYEILTGKLPFGTRAWGVRENQRTPLMAPSTCNSAIPMELDTPLLALLNTAVELRPTCCVATVSAMEAAWLLANQRKWRVREIPRRFVYAAIAAAAAILIATSAAQSRIVQMLEEHIEDARFAAIPPQPPDPRVLVVAVDEAALAEDPRPLTEWHASFGRVIEQIFAGGARAVAFDLFFHESWRESLEFSQAIQRHADRLAFAAFSGASGEVLGPECVNPLTAYAIGPDRLTAMFGFANLDDDVDGRVRHARITYLDRAGKKRQSFAARAIQAAKLEPGPLSSFDRPVWIDYSVRPDSLAKISWKDVGRKTSPDLFRDRLVIIGADYAGSGDVHRVPKGVNAGFVSGAEVQALIANTIVRGFPVRSPGLFMCMVVISVICFGIVAATLRFPHHPVPAVLIACGSACSYTVVAFLIFRLSRIMLAVAGPELAILLSAGIAWYLKSRLSPYPVAGSEWGEPC
jgi:CHASE2 domain-containing sensor protein